jgi:hypothetical protein
VQALKLLQTLNTAQDLFLDITLKSLSYLMGCGLHLIIWVSMGVWTEFVRSRLGGNDGELLDMSKNPRA